MSRGDTRTVRGKTHADLIRYVEVVESTMETLTSNSEEIRWTTKQSGHALECILDELKILNAYMAEILGDKI